MLSALSLLKSVPWRFPTPPARPSSAPARSPSGFQGRRTALRPALFPLHPYAGREPALSRSPTAAPQALWENPQRSPVGRPERAVLELRELAQKNESPQPLIEALAAGDYFLRIEAIRGLVQFGQARGWADRLVEYLDQPSPDRPEHASAAAAAALARLAVKGDEKALRGCFTLLRKEAVPEQELGIAIVRGPEALVAAELASLLGSLSAEEFSNGRWKTLSNLRDATQAKEPGAHNFPYLATANGQGVGVLDLSDGSIRHLRGTIFAQPTSSGGRTTDRLSRLWLHTFVDGRAITSDQEQRISAGYLEGTPVAFRTSKTAEVEWTRYLVPDFGENPYAARAPKLQVLISARNLTERPLAVGVHPSDRELPDSASESSVEAGTEQLLPAEGTAWFSLRLELGEPNEGSPDRPWAGSSWSSGESVDPLAEALGRYATWIPPESVPKLSPAERELYRNMCACLRMGQAEDGQVVASLPPGHWNISWVRDMAYALVAMSACGQLEGARRGLEFLIGRDHQTRYDSFPWEGDDAGVGRPYQISVVRHFGDGLEEADIEDGSPNIEFDGFGLALWALGRYVEASDDLDFVRAHWPTLTERIGDVILSLRDETGLIRRDSGIWERHLPGRRFTFTSAACARGLFDLAALADRLGDHAAAGRYRDGAKGLVTAISEQLVDAEGVVRGYAGDPDTARTLDGSTVELINWGLLDLDTERGFDIASRTLDAFTEHLAMPGSPGFRRTTEPRWYDEQEWVMVDLRIAEALYRMAGSSEAERRGAREKLLTRADALVDWVASQIKRGSGVVPELLGHGTRHFEGAVPMVGYGPGAVILALQAKAQAQPGM